MRFEYYYDHEIGMTHVQKHGVSQAEIEEFFEECDYLERRRGDGSTIAIGKLSSCRYIEVAYRQRRQSYFIITAYDIEDKEDIQLIDDYLEDL